MTDLEKWVSGLETMAKHIYSGETIPVAEYENLVEVVEFLKSMRPVKVQILDGKPNCGYCGISIDRRTVYCPKCGKAVKWE